MSYDLGPFSRIVGMKMGVKEPEYEAVGYVEVYWIALPPSSWPTPAWQEGLLVISLAFHMYEPLEEITPLTGEISGLTIHISSGWSDAYATWIYNERTAWVDGELLLREIPEP